MSAIQIGKGTTVYAIYAISQNNLLKRVVKFLHFIISTSNRHLKIGDIICKLGSLHRAVNSVEPSMVQIFVSLESLSFMKFPVLIKNFYFLEQILNRVLHYFKLGLKKKSLKITELLVKLASPFIWYTLCCALLLSSKM